MAILTIHHGSQCHQIGFEPGKRLQAVLEDAGLAQAQPCGGRGVCGKCAVMLVGDIGEPTVAEKKAGIRLSCQAVLNGDAEVFLPEKRQMQIETSGSMDFSLICPMSGKYGAAVDIGTTTIALKLCDLSNGKELASSGMINPQTTVAADVVGRIEAAMAEDSERLRNQVVSAIETLLHQASAEAGIDIASVESMVVTGNTTMLYLLTGRNPYSLSRAPFEADCLFGNTISLIGRNVFLPGCMHAFVGADISCAVLASNMCDRKETALLCDIGTNGEIALWHDEVLYVTSTAAGPAFEGAGIECGCGSVDGAIDKVSIVNGDIQTHTICDAPATGICGSGLVDAIASMLELEIIDETGAMEIPRYDLSDGVYISKADIRAVQLAKAAIAAGIECLIEAAGCTESEIKKLYLCGGFGSHLNLHSVGMIGLLPMKLMDRVQVLGNAALAGSLRLLLNMGDRNKLDKIISCARHVNLGGSKAFNERYIDAMFFDV